jgi:hypothetical protein
MAQARLGTLAALQAPANCPFGTLIADCTCAAPQQRPTLPLILQALQQRLKNE